MVRSMSVSFPTVTFAVTSLTLKTQPWFGSVIS